MSRKQNRSSVLSAQRAPSRAVRYKQLAVLAARLLMAGIFIYASISKIAHPAAFAKDIYNYQILPDVLINLTALVLPWLELLLGLCLLAGTWLPGAVLVVNGLLVVFMAALIFNTARGLDVDCGCFGSAGLGPAMSVEWYLLRDALFLALGIFLFYAVFKRAAASGRRSGENGGNRLRAVRQIPVLLILSVAVALTGNALRPDRLPIVGDWSVAGRITTAAGERMDISLFEAQRLFANDAAVFIDARPADDYMRGHIQGARSLPWNEVEAKFMEVTQDMDLGTPIITYCDGETCELSHNLALFLRDAGFTNTRVLVNGWSLWQLAGMPVQSGK